MNWSRSFRHSLHPGRLPNPRLFKTLLIPEFRCLDLHHVCADVATRLSGSCSSSKRGVRTTPFEQRSLLGPSPICRSLPFVGICRPPVRLARGVAPSLDFRRGMCPRSQRQILLFCVCIFAFSSTGGEASEHNLNTILWLQISCLDSVL